MPKRTPKQIAADNRERDAMLHTIEELSTWLQQLKVHLAHRPEYDREWAIAKVFGKALAKMYTKIIKDMRKDGYQPYHIHPQFPLPPYEFDSSKEDKKVKRTIDKANKEAKKRKKMQLEKEAKN